MSLVMLTEGCSCHSGSSGLSSEDESCCATKDHQSALRRFISHWTQHDPRHADQQHQREGALDSDLDQG